MTITATIERLEETQGGAARRRRRRVGATPRRDGGPRGGRIFGVALSELDASLREEFQIEPDVQGLVVLAVDVGAANEGVAASRRCHRSDRPCKHRHHRRRPRHRRPRRRSANTPSSSASTAKAAVTLSAAASEELDAASAITSRKR